MTFSSTTVRGRPGSAGVKFADADLIGCPVQVIGGRRLAEGVVEVRTRDRSTALDVDIADLPKGSAATPPPVGLANRQLRTRRPGRLVKCLGMEALRVEGRNLRTLDRGNRLRRAGPPGPGRGAASADKTVSPASAASQVPPAAGLVSPLPAPVDAGQDRSDDMDGCR
ncbi:His/Gly/Thr/Pro-type tRNA ligase C-terminal domain-containing protein [Frankia sp. AiPs1]|uniref:His/Gly/Thr/Pro-type tRNA ligase C-terminal domain-containing protein n=1 Tax=Frankia sp. AiPs1 TaxID=573493 RepID=UPI002043C4A4|nr:His/Gly/Thr/Pro-type tRNA ligase C-terminal domain-containing protein [Frankia sp. AiPs1]MCM3920198.1 His/Gly/Thr/Pro-type tRNA ligase C-terminal domain-containing protein [Frankia sp. AiPs1]